MFSEIERMEIIDKEIQRLEYLVAVSVDPEDRARFRERLEQETVRRATESLRWIERMQRAEEALSPEESKRISWWHRWFS